MTSDCCVLLSRIPLVFLAALALSTKDGFERRNGEV